jgi:putative DNA methylase
MIPKDCKRIAEVDFPIAVVSAHSAREKHTPPGHPSTLHLWWARRPLAACRAMLLALLLPDPCDENCPPDFKAEARRLLAKVQGEPGLKDIDLRKAFLKFIGDFSNWDLASNPSYLQVSRGLVKAVHGEEAPLVVDPFAGGGSIPLEALRLGCEAFASDLNPVACLILKVLLEDIPRDGAKVAEELRDADSEIKQRAEKELKQYYPPDKDRATPIAYLWARTVTCESPNCGGEIPLVRSFWLCKKASRLRALKYEVKRPRGKPPYAEFEVFAPKGEKGVPSGTVIRAKATCPACERVLAPDRVRAQLSERRGGADVVFDKDGRRVGGARLLAVVTLKDNAAGRQYRIATERDYEAAWKAQKAATKISTEKLPNGLNAIPDEATPAGGGSGAGRAFSVQNYGMMQFGDLFTGRQKLALATLTRIIRDLPASLAAKDVLGLTLDGVIDRNASLATWRSQKDQEKVEHVFTRQALPITWDFAEACVLSDSTGSLSDRLTLVDRMQRSGLSGLGGQVHAADACSTPLPDEAAHVWFTDPPYYDAVPYADLSDFFFVWLKRTLVDAPFLRAAAQRIRDCSGRNQELRGSHKRSQFFREKNGVGFRRGPARPPERWHRFGCVRTQDY